MAQTRRELPEISTLKFGHTFTDHMLTIEFSNGKWATPRISPYGPLSLEPSCSVFHYAIECFEGMKAYKDAAGRIRLFRPGMNMERMYQSAKRLLLPLFDTNSLFSAICSLIRLEKHWIPGTPGYSLYIRPTLIGTQPSLGVNRSNTALFFCICCPVGPYYPTGFKPINLLADESFVRSWQGGCGEFKMGANYAPTILPQIRAAELGFQQVLWLYRVDGSDGSFGELNTKVWHQPKSPRTWPAAKAASGKQAKSPGPASPRDYYITEVGTMNIFLFWINEAGEIELLTPPLNGLILPGVTRDSVLHLTAEQQKYRVVEKNITMLQLVRAIKENRVLEMFGTGTAAVISPISSIHYQSETLSVPLGIDNPALYRDLGIENRLTKKGQAGPLAKMLWEAMVEIHYGIRSHPWSMVLD